MAKNTDAVIAKFENDLLNHIVEVDEDDDVTEFGTLDLGETENVHNIPLSFLAKHNIPAAPGGRTYYCTAYGDLFAYDRSNPSDKGIGFAFDTWTWSI